MKLKAIIAPKEAFTGLAYGAMAFALVLAIGYMRGHVTYVEGPSASGSLTLDENARDNAASAPVNKNWASYLADVNGVKLPHILANGARVFDAFKRPSPPTAPLLVGEQPKPKMALLLLGMGFDAETSEKALALLPAQTGLGVLPNAPYKSQLYAAALENNRELWLHIPSENRMTGLDEGADSLKMNIPATANIEKLHSIMASVQDYAGVAFSPDSAVSSSIDDMEPVMQDLAQRGVGLARLTEAPSVPLMQMAATARIPYLDSAILVSSIPLPDIIRSKLDAALLQARESGHALAVIHEPNPKTLERVREWLSLHNSEFILVPPSALAPSA